MRTVESPEEQRPPLGLKHESWNQVKQNRTQPEVDPALIWDPKLYTSVKHLLPYRIAACV